MKTGVKSQVKSQAARIALSGVQELPTEFPLVLDGKLQTTKGDLVLDEAGVTELQAQVADYTLSHLMIDYGHESEGSKGGKAVAAGFFRPEVRPGNGGPSLWATDVRWSKSGRCSLEGLEFVFYSPVFTLDGSRIVGVWSVALTNIPASKRQGALITLGRNDMPEIQALLPEGAVIIGEFKPGVVLYAIGDKLYSQAVNGGALDGVAIEWMPQGAEANLALSRNPEVRELKAELARIKTERAEAEINLALDRGIAAGSILPAERTALAELAKSGAAGLKELNRRANGPRIVPGKVGEKKAGDAAMTKEQFSKLSASERSELSRRDPQLYRKLRLG